MRARRFRPSFDSLSLRITPSNLTPLPAPVVTATDTMPGSTTPIDPGSWTQPPDGTNPTMDPNNWIVACPI